MDELKDKFPNSTVIDSEFELAYYTALSFYPEFRGVSIIVRFAAIKTSMQCRPSFGSFVGPRRQYVIKVNKDKLSPIYPLHASFSALVGCFGHELAHILRYESQSKWQIILDGIKFVGSQHFRSRYEKATDKIAARQGLGYEQYEFSKYLFEHPYIPLAYLAFKKAVYHSPRELLMIYKENVARPE